MARRSIGLAALFALASWAWLCPEGVVGHDGDDGRSILHRVSSARLLTLLKAQRLGLGS